MDEEDNFFYFDPVELTVRDFDADGFILDIGGGGEGVIGRLKGKEVVAIDLYPEELEEAPRGPLKIVMDARELKFLDSTFSTATAFFSLMYIKNEADQQKVFNEVNRVLKPGGIFHVWDIDLSSHPMTEQEIYVLPLKYRIGADEISTGYGQKWPVEKRSETYYLNLASTAGFELLRVERTKNTFYFELKKKE